MRRVSLHVEGVVQGVGFRPFVYRKATSLGLSGWVKNGRGGVEIEVAGSEEAIAELCRALTDELPPPGEVSRIERRDMFAPESGAPSGFSILPSDEGAEPNPIVPADIAPCAECLAETLSAAGRRSGYPFTCCARCGPRFSIIEALPYDRARTSMRGFSPCEDCRREYGDPADRRFHAEPIACPRCGPSLSLLTPSGEVLAEGEVALSRSAAALREGRIVALRGVGGFQLLARATDGAVVRELRRRKHRDDKPFAVLFATLEAASLVALFSPSEEAALAGPEAPIVLARLREGHSISGEVAPRSPLVGAMLPASPLHRLLADRAGEPLVCTSGNLSGEPLCVDTPDALSRLGGICDLLLTHDRPVVRPVDDAVVKEGPRGIRIVRRARGQTSTSVARIDDPRPILGLGAFLKSTVTLASRGALVTSQHLGDMDDPASVDLLDRTAREMMRFFDVRPAVVACDLHPDFPSTRLAERLAEELDARLVRVQHHHAHLAAVLGEHALSGEALGFAWDGYGFGADTHAWGGEALVFSARGFSRVSHPSPFRLPGGDRAAREPYRCAIGLVHATLGPTIAREVGRALAPSRAAEAIVAALDRGFSAPITTSVGRLFDAVAALLGLRAVCSFEGQAAMELEWCAATHPDPEPPPYPIPLSGGECAVWDLAPLVEALLADRDRGRPASEIAARFHASLVDVAGRVARLSGLSRVALSGGCFQNDLLTSALVARLEREGFVPLLPSRGPVNDGGISVGQVVVASAQTIGQMEG